MSKYKYKIVYQTKLLTDTPLYYIYKKRKGWLGLFWCNLDWHTSLDGARERIKEHQEVSMPPQLIEIIE